MLTSGAGSGSPGFHLRKPWSPTRHLSKEADTWILFFKYDSNFNHAVGSEFGEREGVPFVGNLKITTMFIY